MPDLFCLSTIVHDGRRVIQFSNKSNEFIEVVFSLDGRDVKDGGVVTSGTRGYGYPPGLERTVKSLRNGDALPFRRSGGVLVAYIYFGDGSYRDDDLNIPSFMRNRVASRIRFKRRGSEPSVILQCHYDGR